MAGKGGFPRPIVYFFVGVILLNLLSSLAEDPGFAEDLPFFLVVGGFILFRQRDVFHIPVFRRLKSVRYHLVCRERLKREHQTREIQTAALDARRFSSDGLRSAVIWSEVLAPPKALRRR